MFERLKMRKNIGCLTANYHKMLLKFFIESAIVSFWQKAVNRVSAISSYPEDTENKCSNQALIVSHFRT